VVHLFNSAITQKWCIENPAAQSRKDDSLPPEPEVFTVAELTSVLTHADDYGLSP